MPACPLKPTDTISPPPTSLGAARTPAKPHLRCAWGCLHSKHHRPSNRTTGWQATSRYATARALQRRPAGDGKPRIAVSTAKLLRLGRSTEASATHCCLWMSARGERGFAAACIGGLLFWDENPVRTRASAICHLFWQNNSAQWLQKNCKFPFLVRQNAEENMRLVCAGTSINACTRGLSSCPMHPVLAAKAALRSHRP